MHFHTHVNFSSWPGCTFLTEWPRTNCDGTETHHVPVGNQGATRRWTKTENEEEPGEPGIANTVDAWFKQATTGFGIRSIICLLDHRQLRLYAGLRTDLVSYYRENGFRVEHIPVRNCQHPALSDRQLRKVWKAYQRLE